MTQFRVGCIHGAGISQKVLLEDCANGASIDHGGFDDKNVA